MGVTKSINKKVATMLGTQLVIRVGAHSAMYTLCMDDTKHGVKYLKNLGKTLKVAQDNARKYFEENNLNFPTNGLEVIAQTCTQFEGLNAPDSSAIRKQIMPFGKYAGRSFDWINRNDKEYINWMNRQRDNAFFQTVVGVINSGQLIQEVKPSLNTLYVTSERLSRLVKRIERMSNEVASDILKNLCIVCDNDLSSEDQEDEAIERVSKKLAML